MEGKIINYRRSKHHQQKYQMLVQINESDNSEKAKTFIGKTVKWTSPGKEKKVIAGKITNTHGNKGLLRVQFEKGLPGQSLNNKVLIE